MTIALYGGSFNPPHIGHQLVTLLVAETCEVEEVWWVPAYRHAFGKQLAPWEDRLEMCRLAVARLAPGVARICDIEGSLGGGGRTLETLEALESRHPGGFRLVIGADILAETADWHRWDELVRRAPPIVIGRSGHPSGEWATLPEVPAVSSTEIRRRLAVGESAVPLVSRSVMDYIAARGLYR